MRNHLNLDIQLSSFNSNTSSNEVVTKKIFDKTDRILKNSNYEFFNKSESIYKKNKTLRKFYLIKKGVVRISRVFDTGEEVTLSLLKEGSLFGIISFLKNIPSEEFYSASAFTKVELESSPIESLSEEISSNKYIRKELISGFTKRLIYSENIVEALNEPNKNRKLIKFLIFLSREFGCNCPDGLLINLDLTHQSIAECIGTCRLTITRQLSKLKKELIIKNKNKKILIMDINSLYKYLK